MATIAEAWRGTDNLLVVEERQRMRQRERILQNAYLSGPWQVPPDELKRQLEELDPWTLQDILWQQGWEVIGGYGYGADTDAERERAKQESVRLYKYSPLAQWAIWLWSNWGLGDGVTVIPNDEKAANIFAEFWTADRNANVLADDRIGELSNWLLVTGNRFLTFYASDMDGAETSVRLINPGEIAAIVANPDDDSEPWFYKREWTPKGGRQRTMFYPEWETLFLKDRELEERWTRIIKSNTDISGNSKRADKQNSNNEQLGDDRAAGTVVCVLHIPHNIKDDGGLWGWPLMTASRPWISGHKHYLESRLTVAEAVAMFVRRKKMKGGSRALAGVIGTIASNLGASQYIDTNPPAVAGSVEMDNAMIDTTDLPLKTGASDAKADEEMFARQALLGTGLFPTSAGWDTARWATALEMDKAQSMIFEGYQTFWASQFRKMVKIVLSFREKYGNETFEDKSAEVSIDSFSLADFTGVAKAVGQLVRDAMTPLVDNGTIPMEAARDILAELWRINLNALGVDQAQELTDVEGELWEEPEEEEEPEQQPPAASQFQPGQQPLEEGEPDVVEQIAAMISENLGRGDVGAQEVAEWALAQILEGQDG